MHDKQWCLQIPSALLKTQQSLSMTLFGSRLMPVSALGSTRASRGLSPGPRYGSGQFYLHRCNVFHLDMHTATDGEEPGNGDREIENGSNRRSSERSEVSPQSGHAIVPMIDS
jgi:hypothetical protein